jgi:hypothetical protein
MCLAFRKPQSMSQCYVPSLYVIHFKSAPDAGEAQTLSFEFLRTTISRDHPRTIPADLAFRSNGRLLLTGARKFATEEAPTVNVWNTDREMVVSTFSYKHQTATATALPSI